MPSFSGRTEYDVIVAGGGVAGCAAALAAARNGASVLLIEKNCALGGLATVGLVNLFVPMCNGRGVPVLRGMAEEFLRDSVKYGYNTLNHAWATGYPESPTDLRYATKYSAGIFALQLLEKLVKARVDILFDSVISDVECGPEGPAVTVLCEEGFVRFRAKILTDATGTAKLFTLAGAPVETGKNFFSYHGYSVTLENCRTASDRGNIRYACSWRHGGNADLYGHRHPEDMNLYYGDTSAHVTDYLIANQLCLLEKLKSEPASERDLCTLPGMPQLRTVARIEGEYTMTESDLYRHFEDSVTAVCDSERRDSLYEIPYRALYRSDFPNLIAAGRIISATGWLWDVTRVIPPAIVTGQAAGTAAALAVRGGMGIPAVPVEALQQELDRQGVLLHFKDAWIPAGREAGEYSPASHSHPDRIGKES